ncbi:hypothetical protein H2201_006104 [Coniosporium apollinis]|uniref:Uncharacterized protein n=1 Tax=Coniosporium apollinis TaxID=61459 RepID=A0ABQ9NN75_9PEZI|nr:hypothetical protein H2201_006104 [Coniosporium apollinis]
MDSQYIDQALHMAGFPTNGDAGTQQAPSTSSQPPVAPNASYDPNDADFLNTLFPDRDSFWTEYTDYEALGTNTQPQVQQDVSPGGHFSFVDHVASGTNTQPPIEQHAAQDAAATDPADESPGHFPIRESTQTPSVRATPSDNSELDFDINLWNQLNAEMGSPNQVQGGMADPQFTNDSALAYSQIGQPHDSDGHFNIFNSTDLTFDQAPALGQYDERGNGYYGLPVAPSSQQYPGDGSDLNQQHAVQAQQQPVQPTMQQPVPQNIQQPVEPAVQQSLQQLVQQLVPQPAQQPVQQPVQQPIHHHQQAASATGLPNQAGSGAYQPVQHQHQAAPATGAANPAGFGPYQPMVNGEAANLVNTAIWTPPADDAGVMEAIQNQNQWYQDLYNAAIDLTSCADQPGKQLYEKFRKGEFCSQRYLQAVMQDLFWMCVGLYPRAPSHQLGYNRGGSALPKWLDHSTPAERVMGVIPRLHALVDGLRKQKGLASDAADGGNTAYRFVLGPFSELKRKDSWRGNNVARQKELDEARQKMGIPKGKNKRTAAQAVDDADEEKEPERDVKRARTLTPPQVQNDVGDVLLPPSGPVATRPMARATTRHIRSPLAQVQHQAVPLPESPQGQPHSSDHAAADPPAVDPELGAQEQSLSQATPPAEDASNPRYTQTTSTPGRGATLSRPIPVRSREY